MSMTVIALGVGSGFAVGVFLIFLGVGRSRSGVQISPLALEAGVESAYLPPLPRIATSAKLRDRINQLLQPTAERISNRGERKGKRPIAEELARADLKLRASEFLMMQIGLVLLFGLLATLRFGVGITPVIAATVAYFLPGKYLKFRQAARLKKFNNQLSDTLVLLANALRTGYSFPQAIDVAAKKGRPPIASEFGRAVREINLGTAIEDALAKMVERVGSQDFDLVVHAVHINQTVGGNLAEILETISTTIRERVKIKGEISSMTAQARASGYVITGLPIGLALLLYVIAPNYFRPMLSHLIGVIMLVIAGLLVLGGQFIISKVVAIRV